jgi:hypothetical protein
MPYGSDTSNSRSRAVAVPAESEVYEHWLDIDSEPGIPGRAALVAWSEAHPLAVIATAAVAFWAPVIAALWFG